MLMLWDYIPLSSTGCEACGQRAPLGSRYCTRSCAEKEKVQRCLVRSCYAWVSRSFLCARHETCEVAKAARLLMDEYTWDRQERPRRHPYLWWSSDGLRHPGRVGLYQKWQHDSPLQQFMNTRKTMSRKRGPNQEAMMESLKKHGYWHKNCGWVWGTPSETRNLLEALVKRGDVVKTQEEIYQKEYIKHTSIPVKVKQTKTVYTPREGR